MREKPEIKLQQLHSFMVRWLPWAASCQKSHFPPLCFASFYVTIIVCWYHHALKKVNFVPKKCIYVILFKELSTILIKRKLFLAPTITWLSFEANRYFVQIVISFGYKVSFFTVWAERMKKSYIILQLQISLMRKCNPVHIRSYNIYAFKSLL